MVSIFNSNDLHWGDSPDTRPTQVLVPSSSIVAPSSPTRVTPASKSKSKKASGSSALASMTLPPNEPLVATQVIPPSKKRSHSSTPLKSHHKRRKDPLRAITTNPATDSSQSEAVEILPTRPRESANLIASSSVSSQQVSVENLENHNVPSFNHFLVDEDDLGISPAQGSDFSLHGLTLENAQPLQDGLVSLHRKLDALPDDLPRTLTAFAGYVKLYYLTAAEGERIPDLPFFIDHPETSRRPGPPNRPEPAETGTSAQGEQNTTPQK